MKKLIFILFFSSLYLGVHAQSWSLSGNGNISASSFIGTTDCNYLIFKTGNTERMRLLRDKSFLGIGTVSPVASLHLHYQTDLKACQNIVTPSDDVAVASGKRLLHLTTSETGSNSYNGFSVLSNSSKDVIFVQNEQAKLSLEGPGGGLTVYPNGNVGIGSEVPQAKFHVSGSVSLKQLLWIDNYATSDWGYAARINVDRNLTKAIGVHNSTLSTGAFVVYGNGVACAKKIYAEKMEIRTDAMDCFWPDYVFASDFELRSLDEVATFIEENQHLPEIPSAAEIAKNGLDVGGMNILLLKKVEELTLYILQQQKEIDELKKAIK
jgi:hypothetical protein